MSEVLERNWGAVRANDKAQAERIERLLTEIRDELRKIREQEEKKAWRS